MATSRLMPALKYTAAVFVMIGGVGTALMMAIAGDYHGAILAVGVALAAFGQNLHPAQQETLKEITPAPPFDPAGPSRP